MKIKKFLILFTGVLILISFASCKPINLFSPFVDPSLMGTDAKLDAGYNAIASGDYSTAIDYFTDVIDGGTGGDDLTDAYIGRASAYMNEASPTIDDVVADVLNGDIPADSPGEIIDAVVQDGEYDDFYDNVQSSADDYNNAIDNTTGDVDPGILFEAYQANMMAATGVASQRIALDCNAAGWGPLDVTLNVELDAIADETSLHPANIGTWDTAVTGGLAVFVAGKAEETVMMGYLTNAYDALKQLKANPPQAMSESDIQDMQDGINSWVTNGLGEAALT
jgi:hypothetical protein